jgi:hypothetical protein
MRKTFKRSNWKYVSLGVVIFALVFLVSCAPRPLQAQTTAVTGKVRAGLHCPLS